MGRSEARVQRAGIRVHRGKVLRIDRPYGPEGS